MDNQKNISVLNDLLHIMNDRIEGFSKVEGKIWEMYPDIKDDYDRMISQSKIMKNELINLIIEKKGSPEDSPSISGTVHRTWIDIKNSFTLGNLENSTLENVVFGEKAAIEAFQNAIDSGNLSEKDISIVSEQLHQLKQSYDQFKKIEEYKKKE
ncbi:PA2169 family four-helix-bundle protein [Chryseobacterium indologenes]|nr:MULTISPECIES: PA2169 family four-helix-bundle protein [Chryseobacterium]AYZ35360.1 PA2169 family four-helix-bundle protein [Chryseobacterium indologenes]MBF6644104.1 PA2169 family four-helix-bundle protein [Chryseobacterium indologenes]MEB4763293.1 PA2169 family four-helix-bundle protein [Chryseobacterium indologenes]QQQ72177.1 PA2169 family four-helix-bundle protein [Chryseobacterium indologenes]